MLTRDGGELTVHQDLAAAVEGYAALHEASTAQHGELSALAMLEYRVVLIGVDVLKPVVL